MTAEATIHRFHVHPRHERAQGHVISDAADFHDAAVIFLERWAPAEEGELSLIVCDCETGRQECFLFDMETGDVEPCG